MTQKTKRSQPGGVRGRAVAPKHEAERAFPRLRILMGDGLVLGPGKVDLIEAIDRTGSISAAGRALGMSYRRAWLLADALNRMFAQPVVAASQGGAHGGGAVVTEYGRAVAAAYRRIEERTDRTIKKEFSRLDPPIDIG